MKSVFIALTAIVGIGFTSSAQTETERKTPVKEQQTVPITQERKPVIVAPTGAKEEAAPAVKPTQDPAGRKAKRPEVMHKQEAQETVGAPETEVHKNADKRSESAPEKKEMKKKKEKKEKK